MAFPKPRKALSPLSVALATYVGIMLAVTGSAKLVAPNTARAFVEAALHLHAKGSRRVVGTTAIAECVVAVWLVAGVLPVAASASASALLLAFLIIRAVARIRQVAQPCGCFSAMTSQDERVNLVVTILLFAATIGVLSDAVGAPCARTQLQSAAAALLAACIVALAFRNQRRARAMRADSHRMEWWT